MKNDEKKLIDDNVDTPIGMYVASSLGGLIYQRIQHLTTAIGTQPSYDVPELVCELTFFQKLAEINDEIDSDGDMFDIDSGIVFEMWSCIVCVANATKMMDHHFCPKHFAKGVHENLMNMYYG